jgi:hypothetical protein
LKKENNTSTVNEYMRHLEHPLKAEMEAVRAIILGANPCIQERIKWNAPSFYYKEDLAAFNPRAQQHVHLVLLFPKGLVSDPSGLLHGDYKDRRMAYFRNMEEVMSCKKALEDVVNEWVHLADSSADSLRK